MTSVRKENGAESRASEEPLARSAPLPGSCIIWWIPGPCQTNGTEIHESGQVSPQNRHERKQPPVGRAEKGLSSCPVWVSATQLLPNSALDLAIPGVPATLSKSYGLELDSPLSTWRNLSGHGSLSGDIDSAQESGCRGSKPPVRDGPWSVLQSFGKLIATSE